MKAKKAKDGFRQPAPKGKWPDEIVVLAYKRALIAIKEAEELLKRRKQAADNIKSIAMDQGTKLPKAR